MSIEPPAKFFVNSGLVSNPVDIYHLLRPLLKQTVAYRYLRAGKLIAHGMGWVERIVPDRPDVSSFFTPISICLSVASWEHLEFETRPDQLLTYTLVQGDERLVVEFVPSAPPDEDKPEQQTLPFELATEYVQMELGPLGLAEGTGPEGEERSGKGTTGP